MNSLWKWFLGLLCPKPPRTIRFVVSAIAINNKPNLVQSKRMDIKLETSQFADITLDPQDAEGTSRPLDGQPTATVLSGDGTATVLPTDSPEVVAAGGKPVVRIIPSDTSGVTVVEVSGDAEEGDDVEVLTETFTVNASTPNAIRLNPSVNIRSKKDLPSA